MSAQIPVVSSFKLFEHKYIIIKLLKNHFTHDLFYSSETKLK